MAQFFPISRWQCSHTTHIMRCAKCSLIFCGRCHQTLIRTGTAHQRELSTVCPDCGEAVLVDLSPGLNSMVAIRETTGDHRRLGG